MCVASSLTFCPDIRLLTVRAVADVTVESTVLAGAVTILPVRSIPTATAAESETPASIDLRRLAASCLDQVAAH